MTKKDFLSFEEIIMIRKMEKTSHEYDLGVTGVEIEHLNVW